jgi:outer membrane lipoprotein SlyB
MKIIQRTIGVGIVSVGLLLMTGCDTGTGALSGAAIGAGLGAIVGHATGNTAAGAAIGAGLGAMTGAVIGHINAQQQAQLQQQSPQTLATIKHNDEVAQQQQAAPSQTPPPQTQASPGQSPPPPATEALIPLTVDDIKALDSAGVKKDVIIAEIQKSKSVYTAQDIAALQQSNPNIDPAVIDCMKKTNPS